MASSVGSSSTISTSMNNDTTSFDPSMSGVNLANPDELEEHMQVMDVRQRLRLRRRRMIRLFTVAFLILVVALLVGMGLTSKKGKENAEEQEQQQSQPGASTGSNTVLPQPPADLASKCGITSLNSPQGIAGCEGACEVADCCNVPDGYALSCQANNQVACAEYQRYCDILHNLPSAGFVPPIQDNEGGGGNNPVASPVLTPVASSDAGPVAPPIQAPMPTAPTPLSVSEQIDQLCGDFVEAIMPPGQNLCEDLCATSFCCFNHYCVPPGDIDCLDYSGCFVLYSDTDTVDDDDTTSGLANEIHAACFEADNINDAASNPDCTRLCAPGACCFENNLECANVECTTYAECNILYPSFVAVTKQEVDDACNNHRDTGGGPTLCEQVCALHVMQCCFHQNGDCDLGQGSVYCDTYQACEVLGTSADSLRDSHKAELEEFCGDAKTRAHCVTLCSAATCCYASTVEEECANIDASITCTDYQACDILYNS